MRKLGIVFCLILIALLLFTQAVEFRPNTVSEADLNIVIRASGNYSGEIKSGDRMEIKFLTLKDDEMQRIQHIEEKMLIGGDIIEATHIDDGEKRYAVFNIENLEEYGDSAEFEIIIDARLKINSRIGMHGDYDLSIPISEEGEYLLETNYIEVNDAELRAKAEEFGSSSLIESAKEIAYWVNSNITYDLDNYYQGTWSARQTYENRAGVCDEFANLTAAFTRIKGIPTRYVSGISFDGKKFGNHGWLEIYIPGTGWMGLDSTYSEVGYVDALHIAIAKSKDANESVNLIATTWSTSPITVQTTLHEPAVQINEVNFFNGLLNMELSLPEMIESQEQFEIKANLVNRLASDIVIPIRLSLHGDFSIEGERRFVWLRPLEELQIVWQAVAPEYKDGRSYAIYDMSLLSPNNEIKAKINVYPLDYGNGETGNGANNGTVEENWLMELEKLAIENQDLIIISVIVMGILIVALQFLIKR